MERRLRIKYWVSFFVAVIGAIILLNGSGELMGGNIESGLQKLVIGFIIFAIAVPTFVYYRARRRSNHVNLSDEEVLEQAEMEAKYGKK